MILARIILAYQNSAAVNRLVRGAVRLHHSPAGLAGCPLAGQCSAVGLAAAQSRRICLHDEGADSRSAVAAGARHDDVGAGVAEVGDEVDVFLAGACQIQDRQSHLAANIREELLEAAARPGRHDLFVEKCGCREMVGGRNYGGTRGRYHTWTTEHAPQSFRKQRTSPLDQLSASPPQS